MFKKPFGWLLLIIFFLFILVCFMPIVLTSNSWISLGVDKPNEIGDTVGGIMGPIIGFVGVIATFFAFWVQYKFNQKQFTEFEKQEVDIRVERFENKFYEMLRLHRANVDEFEITRFAENLESIKGRKVFIPMFDEFKFCFLLAKQTERELIRSQKIQEEIGDEGLVKMAYLAFFMGIGIKSGSLIQGLFIERNRDFLGDFLQSLANKQKEYRNYRSISVHSGEVTLTEDLSKFTTDYELKIKYLPFSGHISRLGHYYRHLFQTVKYVVEQDDELLPNKYEYLKTLRAQLSAHEQLLLYYNSISILGEPWIKNEYLTEYRMIKNIPLPMANFGIEPKKKLGEKNKKGELLFEWDEIIDRV